MEESLEDIRGIFRCVKHSSLSGSVVRRKTHRELGWIERSHCEIVVRDNRRLEIVDSSGRLLVRLQTGFKYGIRRRTALLFARSISVL